MTDRIHVKNQSILKLVRWASIIIFLFALNPFNSAHAQEEQPLGPVYVVQPGDTMWGISRVFNVSLDDLAAVNNINDPAQVNVGARLIIPGLEGLEGELLIDVVPFGEDFQSLSQRLQIPFDKMARLNRITSPSSVAAGSPLIRFDIGNDIPHLRGGRSLIHKEVSLLELAISNDSSTWQIMSENGLHGTWDAFPGDILHFSDSNDTGPGALPEVISHIEINPLPAIQGKTLVVQVSSNEDLEIEVYLEDQMLNTFSFNGGYAAVQGVHAMLEPGYYPISLSGYFANGTTYEFSQQIYIQDGGYPYDPPLVVNSETIDVENTAPEDLEWFSMVESISPERLWNGPFSPPVPGYLDECYPSTFGNRRSYNGSAYQYFHTGLDFCGATGVEITAPAPGRVVFAGSLIVRGNATLIDHGWGVFTAYAHQSEILVAVGDWVDQGQVIGKIGSTGRVTGPHLHWEVIVGGVQVDPLDWLSNEYP